MSMGRDPEMVVEAPISRYKKNNLKIYIAACLVFGAVFLYDGYLSRYKWSMRYSFYEKHVLKNDGKPDDTMVWNRKWLPMICGSLAVWLGITLLAIRNRKVMAEENEVVINNKEKIPYASIEKIDKTLFEKKGLFVITYTDENGGEVNLKLSGKTYDNLAAVLDHLVAKIS